jgi:hypothetical protein
MVGGIVALALVVAWFLFDRGSAEQGARRASASAPATAAVLRSPAPNGTTSPSTTTPSTSAPAAKRAPRPNGAQNISK